MGKGKHADVGQVLTRAAWEAESTHLIGDEANLNIVRTATYVVAGSTAPAHVKAQADYKAEDYVSDGLAIQAAMNGLTPGRIHKETVKCIGAFTIRDRMDIPSHTIVDATEAYFEVDVTNFPVNEAVFSFDTVTQSELHGGSINGGWDRARVDNTHGIEIAASTYITVEGTYIEQCRGQGIVTSSASKVNISNVTTYRNEHRGVNVGNISTDIIVSDCIGIDNYRSGFLAGSPGIQSNRIQFINCITIGISQDQIGADFVAESGNSSTSFIGCQSYNGGTYGFNISGNSNKVIGCTVVGALSSGILVAGQDNVVSGCTIDRCYIHGIYINGSNNIIENNVCTNNSQASRNIQNGIALQDASSVRNLVQGNLCRDNQINLTSLLTGDAASGQKIVNVTNGTIFWVNQWVGISDDTPLSETNRIASISGNELTMVDTLTNTYTTAQNAKVTGKISQRYGIRESLSANYNTIIDNTLQNNSEAALRYEGTNTVVRGNVGYIVPGEIRTYSAALTAGVANAIFFAWHYPESQNGFVAKVVIDVTTGGGTVGSHGDVGIADDAAGTNRGVEFFDDLFLNNVQVNDSWVAGDGGTQTKWVGILNVVSATDGWIVGQILDADAAALVGKYHIECVGRG